MLLGLGCWSPNRHESSDKYRYGFQGQEKDDEVKGEGNSINYKYRMHDVRVGRFFAVDPLTKKYPWYTPYSFSGNKVIHAIELEGLEEYLTNDGVSLGQVGNNKSKRIMVGIAAGSKEAKNISTAIKVVNEISGKINRDLQNKPEAAATEYLNHSKTKNILKIHDKLETELFNGSESLLSYKFKKLLDIKIGTSQYWPDGPSNFSSEDLGDGKVAFQLPDTDLFILMSFYKPSAFKNTQIKVFKTDKQLATEFYRKTMKAKKIVGGLTKIVKVTDEVIISAIELNDTLSNYDITYYRKNPETGKMEINGWGGEYHGLKRAKKAEIMEGVDSISINKVK
jgi:RHS repeat-associated protein